MEACELLLGSGQGGLVSPGSVLSCPLLSGRSGQVSAEPPPRPARVPSPVWPGGLSHLGSAAPPPAPRAARLSFLPLCRWESGITRPLPQGQEM